MADAPEEKPNIEEKPQEKQATTGNEDIQAVLAELGKIGVENPQQVQNMHRASQETGRLAQMLGEERRRNEEMARQLRELEKSSYRQPQDDYGQGETVDLSKAIRKEVGDVLNTFWNQKQQETMQQNARFQQEMQRVRSDRRFALVQDKWDKHIQDPNTMYKFQTGQATPESEYAEMVLSTLENVALRSKNALESFSNQSSAPHIESGDQRAVPKQPANEEKKTKQREMTKPDRWRGTDDDIAKLFASEMPKDDPFWNK